MTAVATELTRCGWAGGERFDPLLRAYHDTEWGVREYDGRALWEKLILDGFQAGLSWRTILHKRAALRRAFHAFAPARVAAMGEADVTRLLQDATIVRSRAKIVATIGNARAYLAMQAAGENFTTLVWASVAGVPEQNEGGAVPTKTAASQALADALRRRGFAFVGPTIVYAFMQAVGMVNDHAPACFRRTAVRQLGRAQRWPSGTF